MQKPGYEDYLPGSNSFFTHSFITLHDSRVHFSESAVFCLVVSGNGLVQYQNRSVAVKAGDFLFFPRQALYFMTGTDSLCCYEIRLLEHFFDILCPELKNTSFRYFYISENITDSRCVEIYRALALFVNSWLHHVHDLETTNCLSSLLLSLLKHFENDKQKSSAPDNYVQDRMRRIIAYITSHYKDKISVSKISRSIGLNPQYFSIFFSKYFGMPFVDFLNRYRADHSLFLLTNSDMSITEIALDSGFQTYRSYQNAFQKYYGCSPSAYRNSHHAADREDKGREVDHLSSDISLLDFLQIYISHDTSSVLPEQHSEHRLQLDLSRSETLAEETRISAVNIGSGYLLLQESLYAQLKTAAAECPFTHVHFRDVFGDLLSVYNEPEPNRPIFTWDAVDEIIERICILGLYPYIEIGYMPRDLALTKETLGFGYHPCIGVPRSLDLWGQMVRSFLEHCIRHFGPGSVKKWRFGFWNTANICSSNGYWNGSREEFFDLYLVTYRVFEELSLTGILGTPNFSLPDGLSWYDSFLAMCVKEKIQPGFMEVHLYSCDDNLSDFSGIFPNADSTYNYLSSTSDSVIIRNLESVKKTLEKYHFSDMPIIASEWNITYQLLDLVRDTAFMATYIVHVWIQTISMINGLTFSCLSDISEQTHPSSLPFPGAQGLISRNGLQKPAFYAFFLLNKLDKDIIWNQYPCLITRGDRKWHILLYHISDYTHSEERRREFVFEDYRYNVFIKTGSIHFSGDFKIPAGHFQMSSYTIDQDHGCAYDKWAQMGRPGQLTAEITRALLHSSYPELHVDQNVLHDTVTINADLKPHTIILYEIAELPCGES